MQQDGRLISTAARVQRDKICDEALAIRSSLKISRACTIERISVSNSMVRLTKDSSAPATSAASQSVRLTRTRTSRPTALSAVCSRTGGELHVDVATATVTCKSNMRDAAVGTEQQRRKQQQQKIKYHRDDIPAASPDNRFAPFAVEEEADLAPTPRPSLTHICRAGSPDPTTWLPTKTYCMRALAATTVRGVARIIGRARLPAPRRRSARAPTGLPSAATLAHIAHIANPPGDTAAPVPPATGDLFPSSSSSSTTTTTTTTTPMQSGAAMVGAREVA